MSERELQPHRGSVPLEVHLGRVDQYDSPEHVESSAEICETSRQERLSLMTRILSSRLLDFLGNMMPGVDFLKMFHEAQVGATSGNRILTPQQRIDYVMVAAASVVAVCLEVAGETTGAVTAKAAAASMAAVRLGPDILDELGHRLRASGQTSLARIAERAAHFISQERELAVLAFTSAYDTVAPYSYPYDIFES